MADPNPQQDVAASTGTVETADFDALLRKEFKPKTDEAKVAVERSVRTLAEYALSQTKLISSDVVTSIEALIAQIDKKLTEQINQILHHEEFQKLEGAWRGLHYLVSNTETDEQLKKICAALTTAEYISAVTSKKTVESDESTNEVEDTPAVAAAFNNPFEPILPIDNPKDEFEDY